MTRAPTHRWSWLLPCLAIATVAATVPAQDEKAPAEAAPSAAPIAAEAIGVLLAELDACFARGDVDAYLAAFRPDHPGAHALLREHLQRLAAIEPKLQRRSAPVTTPRQIGARTVVRVRHTIATAGGRTFAEDSMLAVRRDGDGRVRPTFVVEIPAQWGCVRNDQFRCPPCNYEIGGVTGWLCVPMRPERAQSLEAASFYLIGTDVACDVSVLVDPSAPTAATVVRGLGEALAGLDDGARLGPVEAWLPAAHAQQPPAGFAAARLEVTLPADFDGHGGVVRFHVVTFGGLQHLLLLRGSAAALHGHAVAVQTLLASYRLLQADADLASAAALPLEHHTGGTLDGNRYQNGRFHFAFAGPAGWSAQQRCGGAALRVVWTSPDGSRLWLTGYDVPVGLERWCERTADRWLEQLLQRAALAPKDPAAAPTWSEHAACGGGTRTLVCVPKETDGRPAGPGVPRERSVHAFLQDGLLLVVDLHAANTTDAAAMDEALASLRWQ